MPSLRIIALALITLALTAPALAQRDRQSPGQRLQRVFDRLDANGDAKLSASELQRAPRLAERLAPADANADGSITIEEVRAHFSDPANRPDRERSRRRLPPLPELQPAEHPIESGLQLRAVTTDDRLRRYLVYAPPQYDPARPTPVVIAFHGGGGSPQSMIRLSGLNHKADDAGFIVVYPFGTAPDGSNSYTWNGGRCCGYAQDTNTDDVGFIDTLLDDLAIAANTDPDRIYATGMSNGAILSYRLANELSHRIAAIAPVAGPPAQKTVAPSRAVPVMHFHGTADELAPFEGGPGANNNTVFFPVKDSVLEWVEANHCDPTPTVTQLPDTADDNTTVTETRWTGGTNDAEVVLYTIENGGHTWPGRQPVADFLGASTRDINANDLMWTFFTKHPRNFGKERARLNIPTPRA
jgi:polyhydroxybutyrate depolymerase